MGITLSASSNNPNYYTYVAKSNGPKRITNIRRLYNDVDSLSFVLHKIEELAINYSFDIKNEVLAYVRTMSMVYTTNEKDITFDGITIFTVNMWPLCAGTYDPSLFATIDEDYQHGMFFRDYFYAFLKYEDMNVDLHGMSLNNLFEAYYNGQVYLVDPLYSFNSIDLIHMFASIDGIYSTTGANSLLILAYGYWHRDVVSWAGDLQDASNENGIESSLLNGESFENVFFYTEEETVCSLPDMLGDIDAMNIAKLYLDTGSFSLSECVTEYYGYNADNYHGRFADFLCSMTMDSQGLNGTTIDIFEKKVFLLLGADRDNPSLNQIDDSDYCQSKYALIGETTQGNLPLRRLLAFSYIDYIYREMTN